GTGWSPLTSRQARQSSTPFLGATVTADIYAHVTDALQREAIEKLQRMMRSRRANNADSDDDEDL
ncbi:hypothetical protein, partial [Alicyclobacillus acidocaldarius]|uniref:hypothetical protein n=1 Tax=Alicyclobacillus acidocaldarius TaxID=405212 RepID=UPI00345F1477